MADPLINDDRLMELQRAVTSQNPEPADAIVWLQGNGFDRGPKVLELFQHGFAPRIFVTGNNTRVVENDHVRLWDIVEWLERHDVELSALIVDDQSMNTLDQAIHVVAYAKAHEWSAILLVGSTHHQLRAFLTFQKQIQLQEWNGRVINQPAHIPWKHKPFGSQKTAKALFLVEIDKLEQYKDNVATMEEWWLSLV